MLRFSLLLAKKLLGLPLGDQSPFCFCLFHNRLLLCTMDRNAAAAFISCLRNTQAHNEQEF